MTASPAVSVILPTHNRAALLPRAVQSVFAQTFRDFELIVVDDGSDDATHAYLGKISDPRLRVLRLPTRSGAAVARNTGAAQARGHWLAFQDSDDEWLSTRLQTQLAVTRHADAGLVVCAYVVLPRHGRPYEIGPDAEMRNDHWPAEALYRFPFITPTWLLKRDVFEAVGGFDAAMPNLEDWELAFRLHGRTGFHAVATPLVVKHGTAASLDQHLDRRIESFSRIWQRHEPIWRATPRVRTAHLGALARMQCHRGQYAEARDSLRQAGWSAPGRMKRGALFGSTICNGAIYRAARHLRVVMKSSAGTP